MEKLRRSGAAEMEKLRRSRATEMEKLVRRSGATEMEKLRRSGATEMEKVRRSGAAEMGQLRNTGNPNDRLFWLNIFLENCAMCACGSKIQCKGKSRLDNSLQFFLQTSIYCFYTSL